LGSQRRGDELTKLQSGGFRVRRHPHALLIRGIIYAPLIGMIGGFFPALRAARLPVAPALRKL
jgi:hypothetical protein